MSHYLVVGRHNYLDNPPGAEFEAELPADMEARALARRDIQVIQVSPVTLQPGSVRLAEGWPIRAQEGTSDG